MKQTNLLKTMLLLCALVVGSNAWAAISWVKTAPADLKSGDIVVIVDQTSSKAMSNNNGASSAPSAVAVTLNAGKDEITSEVGATIQWTLTTSGSGDDKTFQFANSTSYLYVTKTNNGVRVGAGERNTFTIVTGGDNSGYYLYNYNAEDGDKRYVGCYNTSNWRCYTSINSNIKGNNNAFYKKVSTASPSDLALTGAPIALEFDLYNNADAQVINYTTSSTGDVTIADNAYATFNIDQANKKITVTPKAITPGVQVITVNQVADATYDEGSVTFTISIENSDPTIPGSAGNPYTVAEAIEYIGTLGSSTSPTDVYVQGIVSQVDSYNGTYNSITYWISDDGTTTNQMEVYSGKGLGGANFSAVEDLTVGTAVMVKGKVKMYTTSQTSTPEFIQNSELVTVEFDLPTVSAAGWATYVTLKPVRFTDGDAFVVVSADSKVNLESVTDVPNNTPVLLKGAGAKKAKYIASASAITNELAISTGGEIDGYVLANKASGVGFYKWNGGSLTSGKVYLPTSAVSTAREFIGFENDATAIEAVKAQNVENGQFFNLAGQRVAQPTKGLYIVNGKKVIIK